ncbi:MAG: hypothetical protein ABW252_18675 [Polyangiales bacterium]
MRLNSASLSLALLLLGCAQAKRASHRDTPATSWRYEVTLDASLARMDVTVCFDGPAPAELRAGRDEAAIRLLHARWVRPGPARKLRVVRGRIALEGAAADGCVAYAVRLTEGGSLRAAVRRVGRDLLASPSVWLWRPEHRAKGARATMTLRLPEGVSALLPWPDDRGVRVLEADAFRFESYAAFGHFAPVHAHHAGVRLELGVLDGALGVGHDALLAWLREAIDVASLGGRFPRARMATIVVPAEEAAEPVPFGMVARGGEASLLLLVSRSATAAALRRDWVLPHELSHLLLPFVEREHAWISEGFASYQQEVLRARAGLLSEREALQHIVDGLAAARAEERAPSLVDASARMDASWAFARVYWGGAALFFKADVALRARTHGHHTLDALTALLRAEPDADLVWDPRALLARLDALSGTDVFAEALREAEARALPDLDETLRRLGVRVVAGEVTLDDAAEWAELRRAVFAPSVRSSPQPALAAPP